MRKGLTRFSSICILSAVLLNACGETTPPEASVSYPAVSASESVEPGSSGQSGIPHEPGGPGKVSWTEGEATETSVSASVTETSASTETSDPSGTATETSDSSGTTAETETMDTVSLRFSIANLCGADIGLLSTLDPVSFEQVDIGSLEADSLVSFSFPWPAESKMFYLAVYNMNGELVCATENNISEAISLAKANGSASVKLILSLSDAGEVLTAVEFK